MALSGASGLGADRPMPEAAPSSRTRVGGEADSGRDRTSSIDIPADCGLPALQRCPVPGGCGHHRDFYFESVVRRTEEEGHSPPPPPWDEVDAANSCENPVGAPLASASRRYQPDFWGQAGGRRRAGRKKASAVGGDEVDGGAEQVLLDNEWQLDLCRQLCLSLEEDDLRERLRNGRWSASLSCLLGSLRACLKPFSRVARHEHPPSSYDVLPLPPFVAPPGRTASCEPPW